jgi:hypothetical protein
MGGEMADEQSTGIAVGSGEEERVRSPLGGDITFIVRGDESNGALAALEAINGPGEGLPLHVHTREDETVYVLERAITAYVADQRIDVDAGSYAALPTNVPDGLTCAASRRDS